MKGNRGLLDWIIGLAIVGSGLVGILSLIAAMVAFVNRDPLAGAICLVASAVAFGLLANAVLRQ